MEERGLGWILSVLVLDMEYSELMYFGLRSMQAIF